MKYLTSLAILLLFPFTLSAAELSRADEELFEVHVRPVLVKNCIGCHGQAKQEGALRLTTLPEMMRGGDSGAAIVPGKPEESLLIEAIRYESYEMPPEKQMDQKTIDGLVKWVKAGAPWPAGVVLRPLSNITDEDRQWWCIQPIADPEVPKVDDKGWCRNEIDHFIYARLAKEGVKPAREAAPAKLARRVHFALTGLPPDAAVMAEAQQNEQFYNALVDRLLESPAYGENQARLWLDLVRFAESDGYRADGFRPHAHQYRDYVIASFNEDKPYDRFITEQLAGDEVDPGNRDAVIGTMFLRHWIYEHNQRDVEKQWQEILSDITETTGDVFMAQGMKCARCHDHKFDPILHEDYYRMKAFFAAFQPVEKYPVADLEKRTAYSEQMKAWEAATEDIRKELHEIESGPLLQHATREGFDKFIVEIRKMISKRVVDRTPYEQQIASLAARQFDLHPDKLPEWLDEKTEARRQELRKRLAEYDSMKPAPLPTQPFVATDVGPQAPPTYVGDDAENKAVEPGFLTILADKPATITPTPTALQTTGRRSALARWLTGPKNPLTARVMVNRIWQQHFGKGLVETASDFGHLGQPPSHPELLDWLASRFIEDGWSIKSIHRRILTSAAYRQTSLRAPDEKLQRIDPTNKLIWRVNPRRLTGEELIDTVLTASGELKSKKRAVYKTIRRNKLDPVMALFDYPDRIRSVGKRHQTTTSMQALLLTNGSWANERAAAMAGKLAGQSDADFVRDAYLPLLSREPSAEELSQATQFLQAYAALSPDETAKGAESLLVKMPGTGNQAVNFQAKKLPKLTARPSDSFPDGDFTIEAVVLLRSLYPDASVRTIAAHWDNNHRHVGWSFGVTSTKSAYKPRNLILQLIGNTNDDQEPHHYEVVASNLRPELNKPYYLAASVSLRDTSEKGITFYMKDLSRKDSVMQTAKVPHEVVEGIRSNINLSIGGRLGHHSWDGPIDWVRLHNRALLAEEIADSTAGKPVGDWQFESADQLGYDTSEYANHLSVQSGDLQLKTPRDYARIALIHTLLNSNELLYVD